MFKNNGQAYSNDLYFAIYLSIEQMKEISQFTMAKLICLGSDVAEVPENALIVPSENNTVLDCNKLRTFNLQLWYV